MSAGTVQHVLPFFWVIMISAVLGLRVAPYANNIAQEPHPQTTFDHGTSCVNANTLECSWNSADAGTLRTALLAGRHNTNGVMLVIVDIHQACFFDHFIGSVGAIKDWTLPVIAVTAGPGAGPFCDEAVSVSQQFKFSTEIHCIHNSMWEPTTGASAIGRYASHDFFELGWMRVQIAEFATRLGVRVIVSDLDNTFIADPMGALQPFLDKPRPFATRDAGRNNLGVWMANPSSHAAIEKWLNSRAGKYSIGDSDNARYNQLFPVDMSVPTVLPDSFTNGALYQSMASADVVSVHCFAVRDKEACLRSNNIWHPMRNVSCKSYVG